MIRGINVGGKKPVKMDALREACASMGLRDVRTYLQSGNIVFDHADDAGKLEAMLAEMIERRFGHKVMVMIRSGEELGALVDGLPLKGKDRDKMHVTFLSRPPKPPSTERLETARSGEEDYVLRGREVYLYCPYGYGTTKLSNGFLEAALGVTATTRNWRTVNALLDMAGRS